MTYTQGQKFPSRKFLKKSLIITGAIIIADIVAFWLLNWNFDVVVLGG